MKVNSLLVAFSLFLTAVQTQAQSTPLCGQNSFYQSGSSGCIWQRASNSNTLFATGCPQLPSNATGLAIGPAFTFSAPSLVYWTVGSNGNYYYYNGSSWVNTGHSAGGTGFINPGAGSSVIYNIKSDGQISVYNGTGNATILTTLTGFSITDAVQDISADQYDNFYLLKASSPQMLAVFNSQAVQTCTYPVNGADFGGGLAISAGKVHLQTNTGKYYIGSLSGGTVSFSEVSSIFCQTTDLANCPNDAGVFTDVEVSPSSMLNCAVTSITLSSNDPSGNSVYSWAGPAIIGSSSSQSIEVNSSGTYTRTAINCAGISQTSTVNIGLDSNTPPIVSSQSGTVYCNGAAALTLSVSGLSNYQWSPSTGLSATTGSVVQATPGTTTTYTITGSLNNCINQTFITVVSDPMLPPIVSASNQSLCNGSSSVLSALGGVTYTWLPSNTISTSLTINPASSTVYTVIATDQYGCNTSNSIAVSVFQIPVLSVTASDMEICATESVVIVSGGAENYNIQPGSLTASVTAITPLATTIYTITGNNWQCSNSNTLMIVVNPLPTVNISSTQSLICNGETVTITANGASNFNWNSGQTTSSIILSPSQNTLLTVYGTSENGCVASNSFLQSVSDCSGISQSDNATVLKIHPNPCKESFIVQTSNNSGINWIEIVNSLGQQIVALTLNGREITRVSTEKFSPGFYYIRLHGDKQVVTKRLVVE